MQRRLRGECLLDDRLDSAVELRRLEPAPNQRDPAQPRQIKQLLRHLLTLGHEDAGQLEGEELLQPRLAVDRFQRAQVTDLGLAQDMQPPGHEPAGVARQCQPRRSDLRIGNRAVQPELTGQRLELEWIALPGQEIANRQRHTGSLAPRSRRTPASLLSIWRRILSSARSSAER